MRSLVVPLDQPRRRTVPAGLAAGERLALARAVGGVDFAGRREDQQRLAVEVHVRVLFELRLRLSNGGFPTAVAGNLVEGGLCDLLKSVLIYVHYRCFAFHLP